MPTVNNGPAHAASAAALVPDARRAAWREGQSLELKNLWAIESIPVTGEVFLSLPLSLSYFKGIG